MGNFQDVGSKFRVTGCIHSAKKEAAYVRPSCRSSALPRKVDTISIKNSTNLQALQITLMSGIDIQIASSLQRISGYF